MYMSLNHVIIGTTPFKKEGAIYRRQRLANYLYKQNKTEKLIWIYPQSDKKVLSEKKTSSIDDNFIEIPIPINNSPTLYYSRLLDRFCIMNLKKKLDINSNQNSILWYTYPAFPSIAKWKKFWDLIVYDCSDNWAQPKNKINNISFKSKLYQSITKWTENIISTEADIIFTSSTFLKNKLAKYTNSPLYLIENGIDIETFNSDFNSPPTEMKDIYSPKLGFVGGMKSKIDFSLLKNLADMNPEWNIVLIGPNKGESPQDFEKLLKNNNCYWIKGKPPEEIPRYINELDVGLMPYKDVEYNKGVFPLKFYEYLAMGVPVVGCGLPSTLQYTQEKVYIHTKNDPKVFSEECKKALSWKNEESIRKEIARKENWKNKFDKMSKIIYKNLETN